MATFIEPSPSEIQVLLKSVKTIAMVGESNKPDHPSHLVMRFLQQRG